jgi:solute carrier family 25 protein 34/35
MEKKERRLPVEFVLGALASCGAVTVSNPMEVIKTRFQLQGELQKRGIYVVQYRNLSHAFLTIARNEGIRGLQKGLLLAYPYTITMNGTRLGLYEKTKSFFSYYTGFNRNGWFVGLSSGATTGILGSIVANPFFIAKTRMQSYSKANPVGHQHNYRGPIHALVSIFREEGFRGLFRGTKAGCIRISVASAVQLTTYDQSKAAVLWMGVKEGIHVHIGASIVSGIFLVLVLNPFDVITTRLYNQEVKHGVGMLYQGWLDCVIKIWKTEGFIGFYKGLIPHYSRLAPHTILIFVLLEQLRKVAEKYGIY